MNQTRDAQESTARDVEVITTHLNADYDALASMLAVSKLYPGALLVFPGSQERNLRNFFVESTCYLYNFVKIKEIPFDRVGRLILVDTRQRSRLGPLAELADDPRVEIHAYDHHPDSDEDVATDLQIVEPTGSTVTVLSRLLRERDIKLSEDEATILALGIYEDTGNFTFVSTTPKDFEAAGWLVGQGANLSLVSSMLSRELSGEDVALLGELITSADTMNVGGISVVISEVSTPHYVPEFAVLVHKFVDIDNLEVVFALARMEGRVHLVARSRLPEVDVGAIATALGGGGHPSAASATLRNMTLVEGRAKLERVLRAMVNPSRTAADIMTSPAITAGVDYTLEKTAELLNRYNLKALPIVHGQEVKGIITRKIVEKSLQHDLGEFKVTEYMDHEAQTLELGDTLTRVEEVLVDRHQRLAPVMSHGRLVGVVTRTDLLNTMIEDPIIPDRLNPAGAQRRRSRTKHVTGLMRERLPRRVIGILREMGQVAEILGYQAYLVGGSVRDIFLRRDNLDLDVVVEGEGIRFAQAFAAGRGDARVRTHKKFNSAVIIFADGMKIDVATARLEYYQSPAALPIVELTSLKLDLYRRDFTINTLAIHINPGRFGTLVDYFDGLKDIKERAVRVLHNLSFVDDPTRVFRAVRFEQRFGFRIGKFTESLIKNALKIDAFKRLSGRRMFGEFKQMMDEERALDCLLRMGELNLLGTFHPNLKPDADQARLLESTAEALAWFKLSFLGTPFRPWLLYLLAMADSLEDAEFDSLGLRLALGPRQRARAIDMRKRAMAVLNRLQRGRTPPSEVYRLLQGLKPEYQTFIMAKTDRDSAKRAVSQYLTTWSRAVPELGGGDLQNMGIEPGPLYKQILQRLLAAQLDGEVSTAEEERELVRQEYGRYLEKTA